MLGAIQKDILAYVRRYYPVGAFIGPTCTAEELRGYELDQVERACSRLLKRRILYQRGRFYFEVGRPTSPEGD